MYINKIAKSECNFCAFFENYIKLTLIRIEKGNITVIFLFSIDSYRVSNVYY